MNKIQWIAFRILIQFLIIICGQMLGLADNETGIDHYRGVSASLKRFYDSYDENNEN